MEGPALNQLRGPMGLAVDRDGAIFVAEAQNHRVMRWAPGAGAGTVVLCDIGSAEAVEALGKEASLAAKALFSKPDADRMPPAYYAADKERFTAHAPQCLRAVLQHPP